MTGECIFVPGDEDVLGEVVFGEVGLAPGEVAATVDAPGEVEFAEFIEALSLFGDS